MSKKAASLCEADSAPAKQPRKKENRQKRSKSGVESYRYPHDRANIPTDQTSRTMSKDEMKPVPYNLPVVGSSKPILSWDRGFMTETPASPLYIHEKLHPSAFAASISKNKDLTLDMFHGYDGLPSGAEFQWYQHSGNWQNRVIRGESRHVMASLLAKEAMRGKVQMIYFDPPYGINYRKILQPDVNRAKDAGKVPQDPPALQHFRDTYKRGIHSYLDNIYQVATHARELLAREGSFFLQIGSGNVHRVAVVLDEIFGEDNRMAVIPFSKTSSSTGAGLPDVADYILWYAKEKKDEKGKQVVKYNQIYQKICSREDLIDAWTWSTMIELPNGTSRFLTAKERENPDLIPREVKLCQASRTTSQGYDPERSKPYIWRGVEYKCPRDRHWSVSFEGLNNMSKMGRLAGSKGVLYWKWYEAETPGIKINNMWCRRMQPRDLHYVVETAESVIERCILMTTDPGDLVFDPTCGSGTTAYVAEKWGRRWITCDMSMVAVSLARQRLVSAIYDCYYLVDSPEGLKKENALRREINQVNLNTPNKYGSDPSKGIVCERIPNINPRTLAYNQEPSTVLLVDRPVKKRGAKRVSSPFTVESLSPYRYVDTDTPIEETRSVARHNIMSALTNTGIRIEGKNVPLDNITEYDGKIITHIATFCGKKTCMLIANDDCTVPPTMIDRAVEEAATMPSVETLIVVAFAYEALVRNEKRGRLDIYKAIANVDLQSGNLKDDKSHHAFVLVGEPDVKLESVGANSVTVEVIGYDTFDPSTGNVRAYKPGDIHCWMIDTNYDGKSFFARRIHFPGASTDKQIAGFHKKLKKHIDHDLWDSTLSLKSAPFPYPDTGRIAVKIVTSTHVEAVLDIDAAEMTATKSLID